MKFTTALRYGIARMFAKAAGITIVPTWFSRALLQPAFDSLVAEGLRKNAVYYSCIAAHAFSFPEPPLMVYADDSDSAPALLDHPIRRLLMRPNVDMGEDELQAAIVTWMAIGGNCYLHKLRNNRDQVVNLRPYHDGVITPVPSKDPNNPSWIDHYDFRNGDGHLITIPREDIIHIKWPVPDPQRPWMASPPILAAAREVDADNEATRYVATLLLNDAVPRTIITQSPQQALTPNEIARMKAMWRTEFGGGNRGGIAVLEAGASVERLSLSMDELNFSALHDIPEQRICAVLRVPAVVAGLGDDPTYANSAEAWRRYTLASLVPLWACVSSAIGAGLADDFGNDVVVRHNLGQVQALQEDQTEKWGRVDGAFRSGYMGWGEARAAIGLPAEPPPGEVFLTGINATLEPIGALTSATVLPARQLTAARAVAPYEQKARRAAATTARALQRIRRDLAPAMEQDVDRFFVQLSATVVQRATDSGEGKAGSALVGKALPSMADLIRAADWLDLTEIVKAHYIAVIRASWELWNSTMNLDVSFNLSDPAVAQTLSSAGQRIGGISDMTREAVRAVLQYGAAQGWSIDRLVAGDETHPGLQATVAQTYQGRARTIARTELGHAQQTAAVNRYRESGVTQVLVLDNGQDDPDDACRAVNGTVQSLDWAKDNLLGHPNCTRCFSPYIEG